MSAQHATALTLAGAALFVGVTGDVLLRLVPWGVGTLIWTLLFLGVVIWLFARLRPQPASALLLPVGGALLAATGLAWRDSETLVGMNVLVLLGSLALLGLSPRGVRAWAVGISHVVLAVLVTAVQSVAGFFEVLFAELDWSRLSAGQSPSRGFGTAVRGLIIALPALVIFGVLFVQADAAFEKLVESIFDFEQPDLIQHLALIGFLTAVSLGFFRSLMRGGEMTMLERPEELRLRAPEVTFATVLVDALFAVFVFVQFRYLFGDVVRVLPGLTRAEYARRGFFELVWVVLLVVGLLLVFEWIVDKTNERALRAFRIAALVQVALVLVIAMSAWHRMALYRAEFGLTEARVYTTAFMLWLVAVLVWLSLTVLAGRRERFFLGATVTGFLTLFVLHAINADALIVRTNATRATTGQRPFDAMYAVTLSSDATATTIASLPAMDPARRACAAQRLLERDARRPVSWRTWNWSRRRAHAAVEANREMLSREAVGCPKPLRVERNAANRP